MSIFTKDCPVCAASQPVQAVRCGCGYCFDPNKLDGVTQELEVIAQEERLYRDYLAARADQADEAMRAARTAAAMKPGDTVKAAEALLAEQTALTARTEFESQDARAHAVKARIKVVRSNRRTRRQAKSAASVSRPAPVSVRAALAPPIREIPPPPSPKATPISAPTAHLAPMSSAKKTSQKSTAPAPTTFHESTLAHSRNANTATPAPTMVRKPTPVFRTAQATKAAQIAAAPSAPASQECPNCLAKVPLRAKRCRCGYELPLSASQIPSLTMSPEDRDAFLAALAPARSDRNR